MNGSDALAIEREKVAYIRSALRSATFANLLAPNLCILLFSEAPRLAFWSWYALAMGLGLWRVTFGFGRHKDEDATRSLRNLTWAVASTGLVWGSGWLLLVPELGQVNQIIYLYIVTGTMFSAMFGYGVHRPAFLSVAVPTIVPAIFTIFWPGSGFPWPFAVGITGLFVTVFGISRRFERTFVETQRLRFENERMVAQLAHERDASNAANIAKSKFIATASHDLRQPMYAVNLYLKVLDAQPLAQAVRRNLDLVGRSVRKLNEMFNELLDISRADAGVIEPRIVNMDLGEALAAVIGNAQISCEAKGLALDVDLDGMRVASDPGLLAQIVQNILTNAVQNTSSGTIALKARAVGDACEIEIADTGCGIPADQIDAMFEEFYRVPHAGGEQGGDLPGLGLGLSIVRRLSDLLQHRVSVSSEVGQGTRFTILVPRADGLDAPEPRLEPQGQIDLRGLRVLVVDDDDGVRNACVAALRSEGMEVEGADGIALSRGQMPDGPAPDAIVSDYKLGGRVTGYELVERLRAHFGRNIPAIMITADTAPDHLAAFGHLEIPVLFKPVGFLELRDAIAAVISARLS